MTQSKEQLTPHAYLVAGGGGGMRSTIILRLLAQELDARSISYTTVEGIEGRGDAQTVKYPSWQAKELEAHLQSQPEAQPALLLSHCIGTVAALQTLESQAKKRPVSLVSIAPPLPSPHDTIHQPQSQKKRSENNTRMRVVDLPEGATDYSVMSESLASIDPQYFSDMRDADDLGPRLMTSVATGQAAVFAPEYDWNVGSPKQVEAWHQQWRDTLDPDQAQLLTSRAHIVPDAAHGLYVSPRSARLVTPEQDIQFQVDNINHVIDTGIGLLRS